MGSSSIMTPLKSKKIALIILLNFGFWFLVSDLRFEICDLFRAPRSSFELWSGNLRVQKPLILFFEQFRQSFAFNHIQTAQDLGKRQFVFEVDLIVEIRAQ